MKSEELTSKHLDATVKKVVTYIALILIVAELVLILISWFLAATMADDVHSLLSAEGIRFFFGNFTLMLQQPLLVWLLLLSMAYGCLVRSSLAQAFTQPAARRQRQALRLVAALLVLIVAVVLLLTVMPHAVLLSATGRLWPSPFSRALVPVIAFSVILLSSAYGLTTRRFLSLTDVFQSLSWGIAQWAPLFMLYVLLQQLVESLRFVFT